MRSDREGAPMTAMGWLIRIVGEAEPLLWRTRSAAGLEFAKPEALSSVLREISEASSWLNEELGEVDHHGPKTDGGVG